MVETSEGWFYIITSFGKLTSEAGECYVVSASSPIGAVLLGKKAGEMFLWNGKEGEVVAIS